MRNVWTNQILIKEKPGKFRHRVDTIAVLAIAVVSHRPFGFRMELLNKTEQKTAFVYQGKVFQLQVQCKSKSSWESSRLLSRIVD